MTYATVHRCTSCPRRCQADRAAATGYCGASDAMEVASVCIHRGEEPPLNPIVNVFFAHCNLQCIYCQNRQISGRTTAPFPTYTPDTLADRVCSLLPPEGGLLGLVTAAHYIHLIPPTIEAIHRRGFHPTVVYNSSGYELATSLRTLDGLVDVYLPDLKYMDSSLAETCSRAPDYPEVAAAALAEMRRQVGTGLSSDPDTRLASHGIIVRHLVLPGAQANAIACLDWLADHFNPFSLHLSLMAQYYPPTPTLPPPLNRGLLPDEYTAVARHAEALGFCHGWTQSLDAQDSYRPDFDSALHPFEPASH